jgi:plastocyanin
MRSRRVGLTILLAVLAAGGLLGAACGGSSNNATATPPKTAQPAATSTKAAAATTAPQATSTEAAGATAVSQGSPTAAGTAAVVQMASVTIKDYQFTPDTVTITVGGAVVWLNSGPSTHDVTADDGSFKSGSLAQGSVYSHMFDTAGTFDYHCGIHPNMKAQVVVEP